VRKRCVIVIVNKILELGLDLGAILCVNRLGDDILLQALSRVYLKDFGIHYFVVSHYYNRDVSNLNKLNELLIIRKHINMLLLMVF